MSWKFWKRPPQATNIDWPTDAYGSVRFLLGMFLSNVPPFSRWRIPGNVFPPNVETTAELTAKGFQLAMWFWIFSEKYGAIAGRMARDAYCLLADEVDNGLGATFEDLFNIQDGVRRVFDDTPEAGRCVVVGGEPTVLPLEFYMATGFLIRTTGSPYFGTDGRDMNGEELKLAECLRHAADQAIAIFNPMLQSIHAFDGHAFPKWKWSARPGAFERHLQRRHNNPLFPEHRRVVEANDVYEARSRDAQTLGELRGEVGQVAHAMKETELPIDWHPFLNGMREHLDKLEDRRVMQGGESDDLGETIAELRIHVLETWRTLLSGSPEQLMALNQAEALQHGRHAALYASDWMRHVMHKGSPLPVEEMIPALLSEGPAEIAKTVSALAAEPRLHDTLVNCRSGALQLVKDARAVGHPLPGIEEKLHMLGCGDY